MTKIPLECYLEFDGDQWGVYTYLHDGKKIIVKPSSAGPSSNDIAFFYEMKMYEDATRERIEEYGKEKLAWI